MLRRLARSWAARVEVEGRSMEPTLRPGDWLLADPTAYARRGPRIGELVLVPDPRAPERLLVKRVEGIEADGRLRLAGDSPAWSTDSRTFGAVEAASVSARPWFRYYPLRHIGRIR